MKTGGHERKEETKVCEGEGMKGEQMEGTKTDETKPHCKNLGDLPRFIVHAVCARKVATGSNEP